MKPEYDLTFEADPEQLLAGRRRFFPQSSLKWLPGILLLPLLLFAQLAWVNKDPWLRDARYHRVCLAVCQYLGCQVPAWHDPAALSARDLVVRSHPEESDALVVDLLLQNNAGLRQTFPGLHLEFLDIWGEVVASRVFHPREYLGGEMHGMKAIPAMTEVRVSLEILDPGEVASGYRVNLLTINSI